MKCFKCGVSMHLGNKDKEYICPNCGNIIDRRLSHSPSKSAINRIFGLIIFFLSLGLIDWSLKNDNVISLVIGIFLVISGLLALIGVVDFNNANIKDSFQ